MYLLSLSSIINLLRFLGKLHIIVRKSRIKNGVVLLVVVNNSLNGN